MNKKKVMCHIDDAVAFLNNLRNYVNSYNSNSHLTNALKALGMARDELKKSDWISVEDELPPYEEEVLVCDKNKLGTVYGDPFICHRTLDKAFERITDKHKFASTHRTITHWHRIDKLEV